MNQKSIQNIEIIDEGISLKEIVGIVSKYIYLIGLIIFVTLLLTFVYLLRSEPIYEASGQLLIENPKSSSLIDQSLGFSVMNSPIILNTAIERIKGISITDSVIVKTNSFVVINKEALDSIDYVTTTPTDSIRIYKIVLSSNLSDDSDNSDYRVYNNNGTLLSIGFFGKIYGFYSGLFKIIGKIDAILVHMIPKYVILAAPVAFFYGKPIYMWYTGVAAHWQLRLAVLFCKKVFTA